MTELIDSWEDENGVTMVLSAGGEYYAEQDGERVALELIHAIAERHAWLTRELCCECLKVGRLRADLAKAEEARDAYFEALLKPDPQLVRENDHLALGILKLERDLKLTQEELKRADGALQTAHNLAEMWRGRYERALAATAEEALLPLTYFPAGEDPAARWGLTDLGQRMLTEGRVRGPEWVLLMAPDPREVLSIEVRRSSRQETIYRMAGYVTAEDPDLQGGNFLGLLEAFVARPAPDRSSVGTYDLDAACARCGAAYQQHLGLGSPHIPCDGFIGQEAFEKFLRDISRDTEGLETDPAEEPDAAL